MTLSTDTIERMKSLAKRVDEIVQTFGVSPQQAWAMLAADSSQKAAATAEKVDRHLTQEQQARLRSMSAELNTYKANVEPDVKK